MRWHALQSVGQGSKAHNKDCAVPPCLTPHAADISARAVLLRTCCCSTSCPQALSHRDGLSQF
eukprot:3220154-Amphidinium_carterae.1